MVVTQESYELPGADQRGEGATTTTQLAEQFPQIDMPLRVDPPASLKAPERVRCWSTTPTAPLPARRTPVKTCPTSNAATSYA